MADQTVSVSNLPDSGSAEATAFKLWSSLQYNLSENVRDGEPGIGRLLDLYAECLKATRGYRKID